MLIACCLVVRWLLVKKDALIVLEQWDQSEFGCHRPAPLALAMPPVQILWADHVFVDALKPHSYNQLDRTNYVISKHFQHKD